MSITDASASRDWLRQLRVQVYGSAGGPGVVLVACRWRRKTRALRGRGGGGNIERWDGQKHWEIRWRNEIINPVETISFGLAELRSGFHSFDQFHFLNQLQALTPYLQKWCNFAQRTSRITLENAFKTKSKSDSNIRNPGLLTLFYSENNFLLRQNQEVTGYVYSGGCLGIGSVLTSLVTVFWVIWVKFWPASTQNGLKR